MLDGDFTTANKQLCAEASRPLIEAVEKLTAYGSSPEFASVPARISKEVGIKLKAALCFFLFRLQYPPSYL